MATLNVRSLPEDLHDALRVAAAVRKTSIKQIIIEAAQAWLQREAVKDGRKK